MKYEEMKINESLFGHDHVVYNIEDDGEKIIYHLKSKVVRCSCPFCNTESTKIHSTYVRSLKDTPIHNKPTYLNIICYTFECINSECPCTTFNEVLPFAKKNQVMTDALIQLILGISIFLSNSCASLVLSFLGVIVSADIIARLYNKIEIIDNVDVEEIGIDDVATRKGMKYGTAIYDLQTHKLIALLEGRDAESVKDWLRKHKKINKVARDRASAYATAIDEILPECMQVADRFHIFENLLKRLQDIFSEEMPEKIFIKDDEILDETPKKVVTLKTTISEDILSRIDYDNSVPTDDNGNVIEFNSKLRDNDSKQYIKQHEKRLEKYNLIIEVRNNYKTNDNITAIAKQYNISYSTAKKYITMTDDDVEKTKDIKECKKRKTKMDDYINMIYKMIRDGYDTNTIINYVVYKGCTCGYNLINNYVYLIDKNNFSNDKGKKKKYVTKVDYPEDVTVITRSELLKNILTVNPKTPKNPVIEKYLKKIKEKFPIVSEVEDMFKKFHSIIMGDNTEALDEFLQEYKDSIISQFCDGIKKDIVAVKNAISSEISSGFVEGNNNKFKLIKRIVYGKMKLVNLFKKCYVAFCATKDDFCIYDLL